MHLRYQSAMPFHIHVRRPKDDDARTSCVNDNRSVLIKALNFISAHLSFGV